MIGADQPAGTRDRLLATALRLLEKEGPEALRARRLAAEIDASTMAMYTHFGGMPGLIDAMVREGLTRFAHHVRRIPDTDDPVADLMARGIAYGEFALANPQLYKLMFGLADSKGVRAFEPGRAWVLPEGVDTFSVLLGSVERVIAAGRIHETDPVGAAAQVLAATHGLLMLTVGGFFERGAPGVGELIRPLSINLLVGLGDSRENAERSFAAAVLAAGGVDAQ